MRYFVIFLLGGWLAGCISAPDTVTLRHPKTGEVVQCGPAKTLMEETKCLSEYRSKGFKRVESEPLITPAK